MIIAGQTYATRGGKSVVLIHGIFINYAEQMIAVGSEFNRFGEYLGCNEWGAADGGYRARGEDNDLDLMHVINTRPTPRTVPVALDQNDYIDGHHATLGHFVKGAA